MHVLRKKIKQIIKLLFSRKLSSSEVFEARLQNHPLVLRVEQVTNECYEVTLKSHLTFLVRNQHFSDYAVFEQVFRDQDYGAVLTMLLYNSFFEGEPVIIDAGANVGYTTLYFSHHLERSKIFSIEPSDQNATFFIKNISYLPHQDHIVLYQKALCEREHKTFEIARDFRDGKDWSMTTKEVAHGAIEGITLSEIIRINQLDYISVLKIDIEGAERHIFNSHSDVSFLDITYIIAIEIHDEFAIRSELHQILIAKGFFIFDQGELTIGIKKSIFKNE